MTDNVVKSFRVTMTDEEARIYQRIKKSLGLRADAEVLRYLINYYNKREFQQEQAEQKNPPGWIKVEEGWID